ncbi:MAG: hypothetical protein ACXWUX_11610, partial [Allosphingosinicella sp.]
MTGGLGAILLCAAIGAPAQDNQDNSSGTVIGPPQLKDFQLRPQRRVTQPDLAAPGANPVRLAPPPPVTVQPQAVPAARSAAPAPVATLPTARPTARQSAPSAASAPANDNRPAAAPRQLPVAAAPAPAGPVPAAPTAVEPQAPTATAAAPVAPEETGGGFNWLYAVPVALLALLGVALVRRRRGRDAQPVEAERAVAVAAPPRPPAAPRPDPVPRPWLELSLKAERAAFTDTEAEVLFELEIANK